MGNDIAAVLNALGLGSLGPGPNPQSSHQSGSAPALANIAGLVANLAKSLAPASVTNQRFVDVNYEPPPLPSDHISRPTTLTEIARLFDSNEAAVVHGYQDCGKTIAVVEYVRSHPWRCFWYGAQSIPDAHGTADELRFLLSSWLGTTSVATGEIRAALLRAVAESPAIVVVDDFQSCSSGTIDLLVECSRAAESKLKVVLIGSDEPESMSVVRSKALLAWRLPGLEQEEAKQLFEQTHGVPTTQQENALDWLRRQCDGHVGLIRLSLDDLANISDEASYKSYVSRLATELSGTAEQFRAHLMTRYRSWLSDDAYELSRRLTIAIRPFNRRFASVLWREGQEEGQFAQVWNLCTSRFFDAARESRFTLPDLYEQGLRQYTTESERSNWHDVAADELKLPVGDTINGEDVYYAVIHRVLARKPDVALREAAGVLAMVMQSAPADLQSHYLSRLELWLAPALKSPDTSVESKVDWYMVRLSISRALSHERWVHESATELYRLVSGLAGNESDRLGPAWMVLLMHYSQTGRSSQAVEAFQGLASCGLPSDFDLDYAPVFLVLSAFAMENSSPLPFVEEVLLTPDKYGVDPSHLWNTDQGGFDLWRAVDSTIYFAIEQQADLLPRTEMASVLEKAVTAAIDASAYNVGVMLGGCLVKVYIDLVRDPAASVTVAQSLRDRTTGLDTRVKAHLSHIYGDALRCSDQLQEAEQTYREAVDLIAEEDQYSRGQTVMALAVTVARQSNLDDAARLAMQAAQHFRASEFTPNPLLEAQALLEASLMWLRANAQDKSLRCLIDCHRLLENGYRDRSEWVVLAQFARLICLDELDDDCIPIPGFTMGLRETIEEASEMSPDGPTVVLAMACADRQRHNRSLHYLQLAIDAIADPTLRGLTAQLGLHSASTLKSLEALMRLATLTLPTLEESDPEIAESPFGTVDGLVSHVLQVAVNDVNQTGAGDVLDPAVQLADSMPSCDGRDWLIDSLRALQVAKTTGDEADMEAIYGLVIREGAIKTARQLAWYCAVPLPSEHPRQLGSILLWHWRVCWLSQRDGAADQSFLAAVRTQLSEFWQLLREANDDDVVNAVCSHLESTENTMASLAKATSYLGEEAARSIGVATTCPELANILQYGGDFKAITNLRRPLKIKLVSLILNPQFASIAEGLRQHLSAIDRAISSNDPGDPETVCWREWHAGLVALTDVTRSETASEEAFHALYELADDIDQLEPVPRANWHVWLRFLASAVYDRASIEDQLLTLLTSSTAEQLLDDATVPPYLRIRLGAAYGGSIGQQGLKRLTASGGSRSVQINAGLPVLSSAANESKQGIRDAMSTLGRAVSSLDSVVNDGRDAGAVESTLYPCCRERALLRKQVGTSLWMLQINGYDLEEWLRPALMEFARLVDELEDPFFRLSCASEAIPIAVFLEEESLLNKLGPIREALITELGTDPRLDEIRASEAGEMLGRERPRREAHEIREMNEDEVLAFADAVMKSTGLPEDRREFLEDDIRKGARLAEEQTNYCKHLSGLQDLRHTRSPATAYAAPVDYTCRCELLGHTTAIPCKDIDVAISAMKRTYCQNCESRSRGNAGRDGSQ